MFGFGKIRLRGVDRKVIRDDAHAEDYKLAPAIGRVRFGKLCFYYRDLGVKYYVPYDYIERAFIRISETQPDDSPPIYYYRLILMHGEKEFARRLFLGSEGLRQFLVRRDKNCGIIGIQHRAGQRTCRFFYESDLCYVNRNLAGLSPL